MQRHDPHSDLWPARFPVFKNFLIVYDAQQKAIDAIRPGASSRSIDAIARNHIAEKGFKDFSGTVWAMAWALPCMNPVHQSG
ncbi:MAG: M24 family metallopeptidase [Desulfobacterales bacterium]